jgi:signal transduction protein with GAF and PtsI domain
MSRSFMKTMRDVHVHHRGDRSVDGILRLIELAGQDAPLERTLTAMCGELAAIAGVDIVSVYVREEDRLVMRGNHGFPASAIGTTLVVGEGITGLVAECMRPVSAAQAATEAAYKYVPGLGEEHYPVFAGIPAISGGSVIGVLVLQRHAGPFDPAEITLATALGAPVTLAIERHRAAAVRSARLTGVPHVGGSTLARAAIVPTTTALASSGNAPLTFDKSIARLREDLSRAMRRLADASDNPAIGAALDRFALALCDARLLERIAASAGEHHNLRNVARDYARAPYRLGTVSESAEYVAEIEELCMLVGEQSLRSGAAWIGDRIGAITAIAAVARGAAALVASDVIAPSAIAIARAARIPVISDVAGLFGWVRPGDLVGIDGDAGSVLVHPAPSDIERLRRLRVVR